MQYTIELPRKFCIPMSEASLPRLNERVTPRDGGNLYSEIDSAGGECVWRIAMGVVGHSIEPAIFIYAMGEVGGGANRLGRRIIGGALPLGGARRGCLMCMPNSAYVL